MSLLSTRKPAIPLKLGTFTSRCGIPVFNSTLVFGKRFNSTAASSEVKSKSEATRKSPPLAALSPSVLLRSLLISTISSKPYLLLPSLSILSFLCRPRKGILFDVDRNPLLHGIVKKTFYKQFCARETKDEVKSTIRHFKDIGFQGTIMTYAKETVFDHKTNSQFGLGIANGGEKGAPNASAFCPDIEAWGKGTMDTVDLLGEGDYLAVKLTGAGKNVTDAFSAKELPPQQMLDALEEICTACKERGIRILVDAESQHFQWGILRVTLDLMRIYNRDGYASIYNTYQAYLKSTPSTLAKHLTTASEEGFTLGLKLVRGAYIASDERSLIHDTKQDTDNAYNTISQGALRQEIGEFGRQGGRVFPSVNLFLASHNRDSVLAAHHLHQQRLQAQLPTVPVGYGQLHGMSDEVSFNLLQLKTSEGDPKVYKCSTWGGLGECLAYLLRRAIENRDAVSRTGDEHRALKGEVRRRLRSLVFN